MKARLISDCATVSSREELEAFVKDHKRKEPLSAEETEQYIAAKQKEREELFAALKRQEKAEQRRCCMPRGAGIKYYG